MSHPVPSEPDGAFEELVLRLARDYGEIVANATPASTQRARKGDWDRFARWCERHGVSSLPTAPTILAAYLLDARAQPRDRYGASLPEVAWPRPKPATLHRWVATINRVNTEGGHPAPGEDKGVRLVLRGLTRAHPDKSRQRQVAALTMDRLTQVLEDIDHDHWPGSIAAARDTAALLLAMLGALRRSELVAGTWGDLTRPDPGSPGLRVHVPLSKTDQSGRGMTKVLPAGANPLTCGPCALMRWGRIVTAADTAHADSAPEGTRAAAQARITAAQSVALHQDWSTHCCDEPWLGLPAEHSPIMRRVDHRGVIGTEHMDGGSIARIIKSRVAAAGLDPRHYAGHSPRAGFITTALSAGSTPSRIRRQSGHASASQIDTYDREYLPERGNAVYDIGN